MEKASCIYSWIDKAELKRLLTLMVPLYIANLMHMGMGVVDTIVAGQAGPNELAAVALGVSVTAPLNVAVGMVLTIVAPMISRYRGAGTEGKVGLLLNNAKVVGFGLWLLLAVSLYAASFVFPLVTDDLALAAKAQQYVHYIILGTPAVLLTRVVQGTFEGYGQTRPAMIISLLVLVLNIPLNYIFVFGWGMIPALGGAGCGLATAILMWVMSVGMMGIMMTTERHRRHLRQMFTWRPVERKLSTSILKLGAPLGVASLCEMTFFSVVVLVIAPLGDLMVSAQQVSINVSGIIFMLPLSLGIAASIRASYHVGARDLKSFDALLRTLFGVTFVLVLLIMAATLLWRREIIECYTDSAAVIATAEVLLFYCAVYQIPDATQVLMSCLLRGCHDTSIITWVNISCYWLIGFPLSCILIRTDWLVPAMGPAGAWISFIIALTLAAILFTLRFIRTRKKVFVEQLG